MRRPIQFQLLIPTLSVVVLAILLASGASAYLGASHARQLQEDNLRRVVTTLTEAPFPLVESILRPMGDLSGADFVLLDRNDAIQASTLELSDDDIQTLKQLNGVSGSGDLGARQATLLAGRSYLGRRVAVSQRGPVSPAGSLIVLYPEDRWSAMIRQAVYPALMTGALAAVAVILVTTLLAHRFVRPIRQLGERAAAIARGDFAPMPLWHHDDEIRDLALSINQMAEQLGKYETDVRRHEQLRTLDRLGAGMAHQLRNAATGGRMAIELHRRECDGGATCESLEVALRQMRLMETYLQRFMALGRQSPAPDESVSLVAVVKDAISLVRPACVHAGIRTELHCENKAIHVRGDADLLQQLILNLLHNAITAAQQGNGDRFVEIAVDAIDGNRARLCVRDTGPGPAAQVVDRLFEPFASAAPEGVGLGLYVAREIAARHHGAIRWQREGCMTCFAVELPLERSKLTTENEDMATCRTC